MSAKQTLEQRQDMQAAIIEKAWKDENFKKALLADPTSAIKEAFNVEVPEDFSLKVVEEQPKELVLVLPAEPETGGEELSAEDLKDVAGGGDGGCLTYMANTCYPHTGGWEWSCYLNPCGHTHNHDQHGRPLC